MRIKLETPGRARRIVVRADPLHACHLGRDLLAAIRPATPGARAHLFWELELEHGRGFTEHVRTLVAWREELDRLIAELVGDGLAICEATEAARRLVSPLAAVAEPTWTT